jgi:hypothetical protein
MSDQTGIQVVQQLYQTSDAGDRPGIFSVIAPPEMPAMTSTVQPDESAAMKWCARIMARPIAPAAQSSLAQQYAAYFKRLHQTIKAQAVVGREQP